MLLGLLTDLAAKGLMGFCWDDIVKLRYCCVIPEDSSGLSSNLQILIED